MNKITLESGDDKVVRTFDAETWDEYVAQFIICLRGLGFIIDTDRAEKVFEASV